MGDNADPRMRMFFFFIVVEKYLFFKEIQFLFGKFLFLYS